jgi:hypothetical protein
VHPPAFLFAATGLAAMALDARERGKEMLLSGAALLVSVAIAMPWPYFPVWALLTGASASFNANNATMYAEPLLRTFPALVLGIPLLVRNAHRTRRWTIVAWCAMLLGIYAFGYLTANYNYGRVIFFLVFLLQLEVAMVVAQVESMLDARGVANAWPLVTAVTGIACVALSARSIVNAARDIRWGDRTGAGYAFLARDVGQYDVMMADLRNGWVAASFGGKLVASQHPLAFVSEIDQRARRDDVATFFDAATSQAQRARMLGRYRVSYVLAPRPSPTDSTLVSDVALRTLGVVAHEDDRFVLVRLDPRSVAGVR